MLNLCTYNPSIRICACIHIYRLVYSLVFVILANQPLQGKGTEIITGYPRAKLQYLAIPNIHAVRESYDSLRTLCLSMTSGKWHSALENTQWLNYLSLILKVCLKSLLTLSIYTHSDVKL